jgi:hypothetical protein
MPCAEREKENNGVKAVADIMRKASIGKCARPTRNKSTRRDVMLIFLFS